MKTIVNEDGSKHYTLSMEDFAEGFNRIRNELWDRWDYLEKCEEDAKKISFFQENKTGNVLGVWLMLKRSNTDISHDIQQKLWRDIGHTLWPDSQFEIISLDIEIKGNYKELKD